MNVQDIHLDIDKRVCPSDVIRIGQGDASGTTIRAHVYDNGVAASLSGMSAQFLMRLPDSTHYVRDTNCTVSGNVITYVVDESHVASVAGTTHVAYFDILQGSSVIYSTERFTVDILRSVLDGATPADSWDNTIEELIERTEEAIDAVKDISELVVPLMSTTIRGGAKLGDGLSIGSDEKLSVVAMTSAEIDAAVNAAFSS